METARQSHLLYAHIVPVVLLRTNHYVLAWEQSIRSVLHLTPFCLSLLSVPSAGCASRLVLASMAHVGETRQRRKQRVECRDLIEAGFVEPLHESDLQEANDSDCLLRRAAQKRGLTQPKCDVVCKRRAVVSAVPPFECSRGVFRYLEDCYDISEFTISWTFIRPRNKNASRPR